jgi:hypothetical protein
MRMRDRSVPTIGLFALAVALGASGWWIGDALRRSVRAAGRLIR